MTEDVIYAGIKRNKNEKRRRQRSFEMSKTMTDLFLEELDSEMKVTRKTLERVPEGRNDWKPHAKSMRLGYLAALVATMPGWVAMAIDQDELNLNPGENATLEAKTNQDLLKMFDEASAKARQALQKTTDDHLMTNWRLLVAGRVVSDEPRYRVLRTSVLNHLAHHRGQLTVYLRLNDAAVPSIYGPSADERTFG
jgi:uncharacterized damage-inducible protein DinB